MLLIPKNQEDSYSSKDMRGEYRWAIAPSGMLDRAFVSEQQWSSSLKQQP